MFTEKTSRICLSAMVANESKVILRMLESCYMYIDYWIIQDNGSTDGTQDIITKFFEDKKIPGFLYETKWEYPGWNRDHLIQMCLNSEHNCDWILRMDADEQLSVDSDFDWSIFNDTSIQSFNITADAGDAVYYRTWMWNSRIPWRFKHDKRHEVIILPGSGDNDEGFQRVNLPRSFRHIVTNDGQTWVSPTKFVNDALELEMDLLSSGNMKEDLYHLFYLGKSYYDSYGDPDNLPFGRSHSSEYARRSIFYLERYLDINHQWETNKTGHQHNEMSYFSVCLIGNSYRFLGLISEAIDHYILAEQFCPDRNEHLMWMSEAYMALGDYDSMFLTTTRMVDRNRKNPFPRRCFLLMNQAYYDSGTYVEYLHKIAMDKTSLKKEIEVLGPALGPSIKK